MATALTPAERTRLGQLEGIIRGGIATFIDVGRALLEIRDAQLYRATHATWEDYCRDRWGFSARHALRLITASEVAAAGDQVADTGGADSDPVGRKKDQPAPQIRNERQARARLEELSIKAFRDLPPEQKAEVVRRSGAAARQRAEADARADAVAKVRRLLDRALKACRQLGSEALAVAIKEALAEAARL